MLSFLKRLFGVKQVGPIPCPWCGGRDIVVGVSRIAADVQLPYRYCMDCWASGPKIGFGGEEATVVWNKAKR